MTVYTAIVRAVHRRVLSGATAAFRQRAREVGMVTVVPRAVHCPIFLESWVFGGLGWVVTSPLGRGYHCHLSGAPTASQTSR